MVNQPTVTYTLQVHTQPIIPHPLINPQSQTLKICGLFQWRLALCILCISWEEDTLIKSNSLIYKEIQSGAVAKSYMRKSFLIYEEMRKYFPIYEEAVSHLWLCNCSILNLLIYEESLIFFFISVLYRWALNKKVEKWIKRCSFSRWCPVWFWHDQQSEKTCKNFPGQTIHLAEKYMIWPYLRGWQLPCPPPADVSTCCAGSGTRF